MRTIETTATITPDGTLTIKVPHDIPPGTHPVVLIIDERPGMPELLDERGWPVGFFEQTYGSLSDAPIERGDQGEISTVGHLPQAPPALP